MNETTRAVIRATFEASDQGRIHFGDVIARLTAVRVESYHVDHRSGRATCCLPEGVTLDVAFEPPQEAVAEAFVGDAVRAANLGAQQGRVMYPEFKRLSQRAGCIGWTARIAGRHVARHGRRGARHVERFPG